MRRPWAVVVVAVGALCASTALAAGQFDLAYVDHSEVTFAPMQTFVTLSSYGFAVLVNPGATPFDANELSHARFEVTVSDPSVILVPFASNLVNYAPIAPGVAVGSVGAPVAVLLTQIRPDEALINTAPVSVLIYSLRVPSVTYAGSVHCAVVFRMGGQVARFPLDIDVQRGAQYAAKYLSAARVSSAEEGAVAAEVTTWGRLKALYH